MTGIGSAWFLVFGPRMSGSKPTTANRPIGSIRAVVQLVEPIGSDTFVELGAGETSIVSRVAPDAGLRIGEPVRARLNPGLIHLFEHAAGRRINR